MEFSINNNNKGEEIEFPYKIEFVDNELNERLLADFKGEKTGFVQVGPEKWFFPSKFKDAAKHFYNFEARPDDVWVATFPRSGTTWTQELVWLLCNDLDYDFAWNNSLNERFPFFEFHIYMHDQMKEQFLMENEDSEDRCQFIEAISQPSYEFLPQIKGCRFIKTHLPMSLLPPSVFRNKSKIIYVARNPKDVAVSWYHLNRLYRTQGYEGDFQTFYNYFEKDLTSWSPYWTHLKQGWKHQNDSNILFMFYEDMNKDLSGTVRKVAKFLEKDIEEHEIPKLVDYLDIKNFKNNPAVNGQELIDAKVLKTGEQGFVRVGKSGGKGAELTDAIRERIDLWTKKNLEGSDFEFPQ